MKIAAFFDLDGTLITHNSAALWLQRERRLNRITLWQVALGIFYLMAYKVGIIDMDHVTVKALQTVKELEEETLREWIYEWFDTEVFRHKAPGGMAALEEHRSKGHLLVLLTSASRYESEIAIRRFGMDDFLCTGYEVVSGRLTGDVVRPICYGDGKVILAERYAKEHGVDLDNSYFYTDSITDLPMLQRVRNPRVVRPDLRLLLTARRLGWIILDWGMAGSSA